VVRDNGYKVTKVTNLRTKANVSFSQGNGNLTLTGLGGYDPYDTVYKVETSGRVGVYDEDSSNVKVTSSTAASGHPGSAAGDGSYLTYWDNGSHLSASLTFDIGKSSRVQYLGINQREDTVVSGGTSSRIKGYSVAFSSDGTSWHTVKTGTLPNARGVQFIDVPAASTRFVRLTINSLQGGSRIRIDEAWLGGAYPS
jgi:alpha-L-fucosidase